MVLLFLSNQATFFCLDVLYWDGWASLSLFVYLFIKKQMSNRNAIWSCFGCILGCPQLDLFGADSINTKSISTGKASAGSAYILSAYTRLTYAESVCFANNTSIKNDDVKSTDVCITDIVMYLEIRL